MNGTAADLTVHLHSGPMSVEQGHGYYLQEQGPYCYSCAGLTGYEDDSGNATQLASSMNKLNLGN